MEYKYMKEIHNEYLIRDREDGLIQRFDVKQHKWVDDYDMAQIYYGGILVDHISEAEANALIAKM